MKVLLIFGMLSLISNISIASDADVDGQKAKRPSPHKVNGKCQECHVESEDTLNSWFTFGSTKRKLKLDFNATCIQCHGLDFGHGVGKTPKLNREGLPLDKDGKIVCAITCHNMHIESDDLLQDRYHLRVKGGGLCLSCHNK